MHTIKFAFRVLWKDARAFTRVVSVAIITVPAIIFPLIEEFVGHSFLESRILIPSLGIITFLGFLTIKLAVTGGKVEEMSSPKIMLELDRIRSEYDVLNCDVAYVKVSNKGLSMFVACLVKLEEVEGLDDEEVELLKLPADAKTQKQHEQNRNGSFTLRPGQHKLIRVARFFPGCGSNEFHLDYESVSADCSKDNPVKLTLKAYSEGPVSAPLRIEIAVINDRLISKLIDSK